MTHDEFKDLYEEGLEAVRRELERGGLEKFRASIGRTQEGYTSAFPERHARGDYVVWPTWEPAQIVDDLFEELFQAGGEA